MNIRTLIKNDNNILLCYVKKEGFYFLPGGGLKEDETSEDCIYREFQEEMGIDKNNIIIKDFIALVEFKFKNKYGRDILFKVELKDNNVKSVEDHIDFVWMPFKNLENLDFRPKTMMYTVLNNKTGYVKEI